MNTDNSTQAHMLSKHITAINAKYSYVQLFTLQHSVIVIFSVAFLSILKIFTSMKNLFYCNFVDPLMGRWDGVCVCVCVRARTTWQCRKHTALILQRTLNLGMELSTYLRVQSAMTRESPSPRCVSLAVTTNQSSICELATNHV